METMFRDHWLLRAEYRCADLGTWSPTDAYSSPGIASMLSITNAIRVRPQTATPGLGYKFRSNRAVGPPSKRRVTAPLVVLTRPATLRSIGRVPRWAAV
jgi:hypothetical protein